MSALGRYRKDVDLSVSGTVKASAGTNYSGVIDLGPVDNLGLRNEDFLFSVYFPAATTTHFPANTACEFSLQSSDSATFASGVTTHRSSKITGGTAYSGEKFEFKPTQRSDRYWRIAAASSVTSSAVIGSTAANLKYGIDYLA